MADPLFEFDPTSEDAANSALSIWNTASYMVTDFKVTAPPFEVQWAGSVDTEGASPASVKPGNRTISVMVECLSAAALRNLQAKAAKIAREKGTAKITFPANGETLVVDIQALEQFEPVFVVPGQDYRFYSSTGAHCTVSMSFTIKPYGRGPEVDLGDNTETTLPVLVFTEASVPGDVPGLGRLVIDNDDASNAQRLLRWAVQSRHYSSASTAALFYQAESCALGSASVATGPAGASGGGSNNTAFYSSLPVYPSSFVNMVYLGASSTAQTHIGTFRVFARVRAPSANTGAVYMRVVYQPAIGRSQVIGAPVALTDAAGTALEDEWAMVDLGQVTLPKARTGTQGWIGELQAAATTLNDDLYIDWVALFPVDEGSGQWVDGAVASAAQITTSGSVQVRHDGVLASVSGGYLSELNGYEGDYLLVPPAGLEARTARVIVKLARGESSPVPGVVSTSAVFKDPGIDDLSARLFVTPRYLVVPSP